MELEQREGSGIAGVEIPVLHYVGVIRKRWRMEIGLLLAGCLLAAIISLLLPKEFEATASVVPPPTDPRGGRALEILTGQTGAAAAQPLSGLLQNTGTKDMFVGILKSRTMQDDVIKKFDLLTVFDLGGSKAPMRDARKKLEKMTNVRVSREGVISVSATAYDPQMAADMANFFVENLDRLNTSINVTEAGRSRLFLEGRVAEAKKALKDSEERLRAYQSQSKAVVMEGQTKAAIEGAARLEGQILAAEVQMKTLETYSTPRNPDVIKLKESIEEMRRQLKRMEYGRDAVGKGKGNSTDGNNGPSDDGNRGADFAVSLGSIPATGTDLARLIREAKIQETIFTLLTQQLEQAKIAEAKDTPTVRVLDRALPPEWRSRPSVGKNTLMGGMLALFLGIMLAFILDKTERIKKQRVIISQGVGQIGT